MEVGLLWASWSLRSTILRPGSEVQSANSSGFYTRSKAAEEGNEEGICTECPGEFRALKAREQCFGRLLFGSEVPGSLASG